MSVVKVPFSGIVRSVDPGLSQDGQCVELINARIKDGSVRPIGRPKVIGALTIEDEEIVSITYHPAAEKYIVITDESVYYMSEPVDSVFSPTLLSDDLAGSTKVDILGNVLVFINPENGVDKPLYVIWKNGAYHYLGEAPKIPTLSISCPNDDSTNINYLCLIKVSGSKYASEQTEEVTVENTANYGFDGLSRQIQYELGKRGYFGGCNLLLVRLAYKLSSGDYIKHSNIMIFDARDTLLTRVIKPDDTTYTISGHQVGYFYGVSDPIGSSKKHIGALGVGFKPRIAVEAADIASWEGFITSVDVFVHPVKNYESRLNLVPWVTYEKSFLGKGEYEALRLKSENEIIEEITSATDFRLYASYDLDGTLLWRADDVTDEQLALNDALPDDDFTNNITTGDVSYVYNSRLHQGNLKETLFEGYKVDTENGSYNPDLTSSINVFTKISTEEGIKVVKVSSHYKSTNLPGLIAYPDTRATEIILHNGSTGMTIPLRKHKALNMALNLSGISRATFTFTPASNGWLYFDGGYQSTGQTHYYKSEGRAFSGSSMTAPTYVQGQTDVYARENVIKVSTLNNPLYFPAKQTYTPSSGKVLGLCANTTALSQGQFGQYPMYAFTDEGVYAMYVGMNDIAYSRIDPVSRDICTGLIQGIDQSVIFSSERGLMMLYGSQSICISDDLDGWLASLMTTNATLLTKIANNGTGSSTYRTDLASSFSTTEFRNYIEGAQLGYNYQESEIIVTNESYNYSYVYNLRSKSWSKLSQSFKMIGRYPLCLGYNDGWIFDLNNPRRTVNKMLIMTRPMKFSSTSHKRMLQAALRGLVHKSNSDLYFRGEPVYFRDEPVTIFHEIGMYILGSNDAEHFVLLEGKELSSETNMRDIITQMNKTKPYKYFIACICGGVRSDVAINCLDIDLDLAYENRLR